MHAYIHCHQSFIGCITFGLPVPVAARSKAWVYGRLPAAIVGSNATEDMDVCCVCCVL
jgi:hypothetical protein